MTQVSGRCEAAGLATNTNVNHQTIHRAPRFSREMATLICGHLRKDRDTQTLASLARTAKIFLEPALDALWSRIPGITPLLRLLPSDLWEIYQVVVSDSEERGPLYVLVCLRAPI